MSEDILKIKDIFSSDRCLYLNKLNDKKLLICFSIKGGYVYLGRKEINKLIEVLQD